MVLSLSRFEAHGGQGHCKTARRSIKLQPGAPGVPEVGSTDHGCGQYGPRMRALMAGLDLGNED